MNGYYSPFPKWVILRKNKKRMWPKQKNLFLGQQHDSNLKLRTFLFIGVLIHIPLNNHYAFFLYIAREQWARRCLYLFYNSRKINEHFTTEKLRTRERFCNPNICSIFLFAFWQISQAAVLLEIGWSLMPKREEIGIEINVVLCAVLSHFVSN